MANACFPETLEFLSYVRIIDWLKRLSHLGSVICSESPTRFKGQHNESLIQKNDCYKGGHVKMSINNLRGITLVRGPIWGIYSLTLIISCWYIIETIKGRERIPVEFHMMCYTLLMIHHLLWQFAVCYLNQYDLNHSSAKFLNLKAVRIRIRSYRFHWTGVHPV